MELKTIELLGFFGLKPTDTVVEACPGTGRFTAILASYLKSAGRLIVALQPDHSIGAYPDQKLINQQFRSLVSTSPVFSSVDLIELPVPAPWLTVLQGKVDAVLDLHPTYDWAYETKAELINASFDLLRPGGVLGMMEQRVARQIETGHKPADTAMLIRTVQETGLYLHSTASRENGQTASLLSEVRSPTSMSGAWNSSIKLCFAKPLHPAAARGENNVTSLQDYARHRNRSLPARDGS